MPINIAKNGSLMSMISILDLDSANILKSYKGKYTSFIHTSHDGVHIFDGRGKYGNILSLTCIELDNGEFKITSHKEI